MRSSVIGLKIALAVGLGLAACSEQEDTGAGDRELEGTGAQGSGGTGSGGTGTDVRIETGGSAGSAEQRGGTRPVTPAEVEQMRSSSCAGWSAEPEPSTAILELVVDVSNSMNDPARESDRASKWHVTRDALSAAIAALPASAAVGVTFFPAMLMESANWDGPIDVSECIDTRYDVPMGLLEAPGSEHRSAIEASLAQVRVTGGTPTHDAYKNGLAALNAATLPGDRFMVLITDGQPTYAEGCYGSGMAEDAQPTDPIVAAIRDAREDGIRTFVIGSPGSERSSETFEDLRPWLSEAATVGGTARLGCSDTGPDYCHFDMSVEPDFDQGLRSALAAISGQIVSCDYALPAPPPEQSLNPTAVNVFFTKGSGEVLMLLKNSSAECDEGWYYSADQQRVELCSESCDAVKADPRAKLELLFGCSTEVAIP